MKILATFDGSSFAEAIMPLLGRMALLPEAEVRLLAVATEPHERRAAPPSTVPTAAVANSDAIVVRDWRRQPAETKDQAVQRALVELNDYLLSLVAQLPVGPKYQVDAHLGNDAGAAIVALASKEAPDVIVMATHGHGGLRRAVFGSTTEHVVRSGIAPVLLVHPNGRRADGGSRK